MRAASSGVEADEEVYGLSRISTTAIIPTELNSYMYRFEGHLSAMANALGKPEDEQTYQQAATDRKFAINELMWNHTTMR